MTLNDHDLERIWERVFVVLGFIFFIVCLIYVLNYGVQVQLEHMDKVVKIP